MVSKSRLRSALGIEYLKECLQIEIDSCLSPHAAALGITASLTPAHWIRAHVKKHGIGDFQNTFHDGIGAARLGIRDVDPRGEAAPVSAQVVSL